MCVFVLMLLYSLIFLTGLTHPLYSLFTNILIEILKTKIDIKIHLCTYLLNNIIQKTSFVIYFK